MTSFLKSLLFACASLLGAVAIAWMAHGFAGTHSLAFAVTLSIGGGYLIGIMELVLFRRATSTLTGALDSITPQMTATPQWFEHWLVRLHPSVCGAVRLRIEGERSGLPAPVFTPYLVGLLVMLGLLGTFIGMVDTLGGAVAALQGSTELDAIRASLTAPMQGLGVAFGTSVAGVAASAMLGLLSTLSRHERIQATRRLDANTATVFRDFSLAHQRMAAFSALQSQAGALPGVADDLRTVAAQLTLMGEKLSEALLAEQARFHDNTALHYRELAASVDNSLRTGMAASGKAAGESMQPVVTSAMAEIARILRDSIREISDNTHSSTTSMLAEVGGLLSATEALVEARTSAEAALLDKQSAHLEQLTAAVTEQFGALRLQEERHQSAALTRLGELEGTVAGHLTQLGAGLEGPLTRLIETASETPRAAAEVIALLRAEISNNVERDTQMLEERLHVMQELNALSIALQNSAHEQRDSVKTLVSSSTAMLQEVTARFSDQLLAEVAKMSEASAHVAGGAIELSSLGEAFRLAVDLFNSSNEAMMEHLARVEESMQQSSARSDEQMAYYVAQAREIIDHSMLSQKEIMEDMRRINRRTRQLAAGAQ